MNKKTLTIGSLKQNKNDDLLSSKQLINNEEVTVKSTKQDIIEFKHQGQKYSLNNFQSDVSLLDNALSQGEPINYKCKKGNCGKCLVNIVSGSEFLTNPSEKELEKLDSKLKDGDRLSCQTILLKD